MINERFLYGSCFTHLYRIQLYISLDSESVICNKRKLID